MTITDPPGTAPAPALDYSPDVAAIDEVAESFRKMFADDPRSSRIAFEALAVLTSTLNRRELLTYLADLCTRLTRCRASFVYLWDPTREMLVVRAAVKEFEKFVDRFALSLGEGLAGWSALTKQPLVIERDAPLDSRFRFVAEMGDDEFQSYLAFPIVASPSRLIGVLMLQAEAPHVFGDDDLTMLNTLSCVIATAIDNAELYEYQVRQVDVLQELAIASRVASQSSSSSQLVSRLAKTAAMLTKAQHCFVIAAEAHAAQVRVLTFWSNSRSLLADLPPTIPMSTDWASLLGATEPHVLHRQARRQGYGAIDRLVPGSDHAVIAPMPMPDGGSGLFICLYGDEAVPEAAEAGIVSILAVQAAVGVQNAELRESLRSKNESREILEALMLGADADMALESRGRRLGFDVGRPHVVALFDVSPAAGSHDLDEVVSLLRRELEVAFPRSLTSGNDQLVTGVLESSSQTTSEALLRRLSNVRARVYRSRPGATVTIGVSRPCSAVRDYPLAREQARRTLTVGRMLVGPDSVACFDDLGVQWHLVSLAQQPERDVFQLAFERLLEYDRANSTQLFRSIEVYLESLGNAKDASNKLFVHRNTLRQRLDKVTRVAGVDLSREGNWFESMLALRLVRLRAAADAGR